MRNCDAIVIKNESKLYLIFYYFVDLEFNSEIVSTKMVEIDAEKESHDVISQVQIRGWLCYRYLPP